MEFDFPDTRVRPKQADNNGACHIMQPPQDSAVAAQDDECTRLAASFAAEPELISACLEGLERQPAGAAQRIASAAHRALLSCPEYADLNYHASRAALAAGEMQAAAELLEAAVRINPRYCDARILAARVALQQARPRQARAHLAAAIAAGAAYPDVHLLLGDAWRQEQEWSRARDAYTRALELNSHLSAARTALAALPPLEAGRSDELPS
jgi:tetratricopeptide (TPR) repeat protein